jgi:hybrid cluster-associated redox disulfide protein
MFWNRKTARKPTIDPDMPVDEIMRRWPATIGVMIRHGMLCVGCPIGSFHTVSEACAEHEVEEELFVRELVAAIGG